jgi:hypothetical protein
MGDVPVSYALIRTQNEADHADRLNEMLYGPQYRDVQVPPHPFMGPALTKSLPRIPNMWSSSVRSN